MGDAKRRNGFHDFGVASRKAEEATGRRYLAAEWLQSLVGPLGTSKNPSEGEFISCLRNGLILCNAINKIHPGAVPRVVDNVSHSQSITRDSQPLPAYQYFENVKNFLVAVEELKLPAFEASDLERDTIESGSAAKVVDCILALKSYQEWKLNGGENVFNKQVKSPFVVNSANRMHSRAPAAFPSDSRRRLDMSVTSEKQSTLEAQLVESIVKLFADCMVDSKENINASFLDRHQDPIKTFRSIMSSCFGEKLQKKSPELLLVFKDILKGSSCLPTHSTSMPSEDASAVGNINRCRACINKGPCNHSYIFYMQEKELLKLKALLSSTKREFVELQNQLLKDLNDLASNVQEISTAALGYHNVAMENRNLYNMVQDLKGNIRVYCRIRPSFCVESKNAIDFIGEDGSLVILDPSKSKKDGKKVFKFNRIFGPTASQGDVFKDTQPLIRSVMDGYNACIFAYGQTGSGKTHTMSGPSGRSTKGLGINYLALNDLFQMSSKRKDIITYDIYVQMVEIYNEQVRDLFTEGTSANKLEIRSCSDDGISLPDATMHPVKSTYDVLNLMKLGEVNRVVSSTALNSRSSRSHSVLTVHVYGKDISGSTIRSCLHLVDLAGSERVDKSEVTGERLKEAQYINKSLSCLGDVITALAQKNTHIPYRNSKLTLLLQDSLGGSAKTLMFAHVSPDEDSFGETISTLKFAQRVSTVELGAARMNKESSEVMQLKEQIECLQKAVANKEAKNAEFNKTKEPQTPSEKQKELTERTPPRQRRLSIENCKAIKTERAVNPEDRKGLLKTPVTTRSRRLSLEGPKYGKKENSQTKASHDASKAPQFDSASIQKNCQLLDAEALSKTFGRSSNGLRNIGAYHAKTPPRSPTSIIYQKRQLKTDGRIQIHPIQLPQTSEPSVLATNEYQIAMQNQFTLSTDFQTPDASAGTNGKGSQIRRSLRTIGKLINGSEKRNQQQYLMEAKSPSKGTSNVNDGKTPKTTNSRTLRQSLTGIQTPGLERSRRSSIGGKQAENHDTTIVKTPPPVHQSSKMTKRWL